METYKVKISDLAQRDIKGIATYIRDELLEPGFAESTTETILNGIFTLESMPARVPLVRDERLAAMQIRGLPIKNHIVFFRINENQKIVEVVRVLHSQQNWQAIL